MTITLTGFQSYGPLLEKFQERLSSFDGSYSLIYRQFQRQIVQMSAKEIESMIAEGRLNDAKEKLADLESKKEPATA